MTESTALLLRRLASARGPRAQYRGAYGVITLLLRLIAVALRASFVVASLVVESITVLLLLGWSVLTAARVSGTKPPVGSDPPVRPGR